MDTQQILAILPAATGTTGPILTAFSVNQILHELNLARQFLGVTTEAIGRNERHIPVFEGLDKRFDRASKKGSTILWVGVTLLALGFILQAVSTLSGSSNKGFDPDRVHARAFSTRTSPAGQP